MIKDLVKNKVSRSTNLGCIGSRHRVTYATVTDSQKKPISYTYLYQLVTAQIIISIIISIPLPSHYFTMTRESKLLNRPDCCVNVGGLCSYIPHFDNTQSQLPEQDIFCSFVSIHAFLWTRTVLTSKCFSILNPKVTYFIHFSCHDIIMSMFRAKKK